MRNTTEPQHRTSADPRGTGADVTAAVEAITPDELALEMREVLDAA